MYAVRWVRATGSSVVWCRCVVFTVCCLCRVVSCVCLASLSLSLSVSASPLAVPLLVRCVSVSVSNGRCRVLCVSCSSRCSTSDE